MLIILLILVLSAIAYYFRAPIFEFTFGVLLATPVFGFIVGKLINLNLPVYALIFIITTGICTYLLRNRGNKNTQFEFQNFFPIGIFILTFLLAHTLCLRWADFFPMGERLRDYSLLGSALKSPTVALEPWMEGASLNYYMYWYRFGHMVSTLTGMQLWNLYHFVMSFSIAFYTTAIFNLLFKYINFSLIGSIFSAVIVSFGSNIQGFINYYNKDDGWWGPSRVVKGAINEFPVWSFVLGDAHPHYLNLGLFPYFASILALIIFTNTNKWSKVLGLSMIGAVGCAFTYNSNAWEVPMWGIFGIILLIRFIIQDSNQDPENTFKIRYDYIIASLITLFILFLSSRNIEGVSQTKEFVVPPVEKTTLKEIFLHWGFPLFTICLSQIILLKGFHYRMLALFTIIASCMFYHAYGLLLVVFFINFIRVFNTEQTRFSIIPESLGILSLILLLMPEAFYLNDAYGGENERMNTIFKIYSFAWMPFHVFAFYLIVQIGKIIKIPNIQNVPSLALNMAKIFVLSIVLSVSLAFFSQLIRIRTVKESLKSPDRAEGLGDAERKFSGSSSVIRKLRDLPQGIVLEGQGNPYDWTSFVSTLSNQTSYLGWANHVQLLSKKYDEVGRREKITEQIYKENSCDAKKNLMGIERIKYVVLGPLERKKYGQIPEDNFSCLNVILSVGDYKLYSY